MVPGEGQRGGVGQMTLQPLVTMLHVTCCPAVRQAGVAWVV